MSEGNEETNELYERHRDRCDELRDIVEDLSLIWGPGCVELQKAVDAYEREPLLLAELERLRHLLEESAATD